MGYGINPTNDHQKVDLLATIVPFTIFNIAPNIGVKDKKVTVEISGVKLLNTETFRLRQSNPWFELVAESVYEFSDNKVFATFDLANVPIDTYSIDAIKADSSLAYIENGFQVIESGQEDIQITINTPTHVNVRRSPVRIEINYINVGDADAINPVTTCVSVVSE